MSYDYYIKQLIVLLILIIAFIFLGHYRFINFLIILISCTEKILTFSSELKMFLKIERHF